MRTFLNIYNTALKNYDSLLDLMMVIKEQIQEARLLGKTEKTSIPDGVLNHMTSLKMVQMQRQMGTEHSGEGDKDVEKLNRVMKKIAIQPKKEIVINHLNPDEEVPEPVKKSQEKQSDKHENFNQPLDDLLKTAKINRT